MRTNAYWVVRFLPMVDALGLATAIALCTPAAMLGRDQLSLLILMLVVPLAHWAVSQARLYESHRLEGVSSILRNLLAAYLLTLTLTLAPILLLRRLDLAVDLSLAFGLAYLVLGAGKAIVFLFLQRLRRRGFDVRHAVFVGRRSEAEEYAGKLASHPEWGLRVDCLAQRSEQGWSFTSYRDGSALPGELEAVLSDRAIDEVLVPVKPADLERAVETARTFERYGLTVRLLLEPVEDSTVQPMVHEFAGGPALALTSVRQDDEQRAVKRMFDILVSSAALIVAAVPMTAIAIAIRLTSPGPALFRQVRVGLNGRRFSMLKFRTMVNGAELLVRHADRSITQGPIFKDPTDYRVTPLGRFLRKFSLDELPQLWNVLRGEMSIVGPRPLPVYEAALINGDFRRRFAVPPGLTCIWQVSGRSDVTYDSWMKYDLQYIETWSFWSDLKLCLQTIPVVIAGKGGY